ncbi:MAG TPA: SAM-dependent chlorinase/fluorinase [Ktedonobacterales bacterium]
MPPILTLTTDFGQADGYVGTMKGVILARAPQAQLVDLSHEIAPGDIAAGAFVLYQSSPYFPAGTVHLAVVDPGVGTARRPLLLQTAQGFFVGPDNGLFGYVLIEAVAKAASWRGVPESVPASFHPDFSLQETLFSASSGNLPKAYHLDNPAYWLAGPSATFHGRDIFAPVAAHLALGIAPHNFGTSLALDSLNLLPTPAPTRAPGTLQGRVIACDRFGNVISNIAAGLVEALGAMNRIQIQIGAHSLSGVQQTYGTAASGEVLALINSAGLLEVAIRDGNAAQALGVSVGEKVICQMGDS